MLFVGVFWIVIPCLTMLWLNMIYLFSDVTSNVPGRELLNTKRANWKKFKEICSQDIPLILSHLDKCNDKDLLNGIVHFIALVIFRASTKSMPIKRHV